jgi:hypothetical protein
MPEIRFSIPKGCKGIVIDHRGFVGPSCYQMSEQVRRLMASMGVTFADEQIIPKDEAHAVEDVTIVNTQTEKAGE